MVMAAANSFQRMLLHLDHRYGSVVSNPITNPLGEQYRKPASCETGSKLTYNGLAVVGQFELRNQTASSHLPTCAFRFNLAGFWPGFEWRVGATSLEDPPASAGCGA